MCVCRILIKITYLLTYLLTYLYTASCNLYTFAMCKIKATNLLTYLLKSVSQLGSPDSSNVLVTM